MASALVKLQARLVGNTLRAGLEVVCSCELEADPSTTRTVLSAPTWCFSLLFFAELTCASENPRFHRASRARPSLRRQESCMYVGR